VLGILCVIFFEVPSKFSCAKTQEKGRNWQSLQNIFTILKSRACRKSETYISI